MKTAKTLYELLEGTTDRKFYQLCAAIEELATISNETISNLHKRLEILESDKDWLQQQVDQLEIQLYNLEDRH